MPIVPLSELSADQEADFFALLTVKEELTTKTGKPYFRVSFRDAGREVSFPIWDNSPWAADCRDSWTPGAFYKIRAVYRESNYGPQLEIRKIREATDADAADGFDPAMCRPQSRFEPEAMFGELFLLIEHHIEHAPLRKLVELILSTNREEFTTYSAARHNHHAYLGGLLEHTLSVTRTAAYLADKYAEYYPDMQPPLDRGLVVAGAVLHDVGKIRELSQRPEGATYTAEGSLIGHMLLGRDMVREAAAEIDVDAETLLRLEHTVIAHQRLPEWGSPKPPMTPEALIVHYADDLDAKFHMMVSILRDDANPGPVTSRKNILMQHVFRGLES
ncbi:MAG: HD domain-containing protein [Candidatus Nealsonbacteria bacterium]|nr:HD domain-containing protein [Candidatus Nealsonbacteria bacterium]